jgi:hypothetical protein
MIFAFATELAKIQKKLRLRKCWGLQYLVECRMFSLHTRICLCLCLLVSAFVNQILPNDSSKIAVFKFLDGNH